MNIFRPKYGNNKKTFLLIVILLSAYLISLLSFLFVGNKAMVVNYNDKLYFPLINSQAFENDYLTALDIDFELDYLELQRKFQAANGSEYVIMPLYPYNATGGFVSSQFNKPNMSFGESVEGYPIHIFGTDHLGRDVFSQALYGFKNIMNFAVFAVLFQYIFGVIVGVTMGYLGRRVDLILHRFTEVWSNIPTIFIFIIIASISKLNLFMIILIYSALTWIKISILLRAEILKTSNMSYVKTATAFGFNKWMILIKNILPNSTTPIIAYIPFAIANAIITLTTLDFLGLGLSNGGWGEMMNSGFKSMSKGHYEVIIISVLTLTSTLLLVNKINNGVKSIFTNKLNIHYGR